MSVVALGWDKMLFNRKLDKCGSIVESRPHVREALLFWANAPLLGVVVFTPHGCLRFDTLLKLKL